MLCLSLTDSTQRNHSRPARSWSHNHDHNYHCVNESLTGITGLNNCSCLGASGVVADLILSALHLVFWIWFPMCMSQLAIMSIIRKKREIPHGCDVRQASGIQTRKSGSHLGHLFENGLSKNSMDGWIFIKVIPLYFKFPLGHVLGWVITTVLTSFL